MYSDRLQVHDNVSMHDRDHGLLFNYANAPESRTMSRAAAKSACSSTTPTRIVSRQLVRGLPDRRSFHRRVGAQRITENAFVANRTQVMYVGTERWTGR